MGLTALLLVATTIATAATPLRLHVDPARGCDDASGNKTHPLASVLAAQLALREQRTPDASVETAEVVLRRGTHQIPPGGLHFDGRDSGARYSGEPGALVSGGHLLAGWEKNGTGELWRTPLPAANRTRQLYAFGARARRASMQWQPGWTAGLLNLTSRGYVFKERQPWMESPDVEQFEFVYTGDTSVW